MMFFRFDEPVYADETEYADANCCLVDYEETLYMPGMVCPYCETTWSMSGVRLLTDKSLSSRIREQLLHPRAIPFEEYQTLSVIVRQELQLRSSTRLWPGMRVGPLYVRCECIKHVADFLWAGIGNLIVTQRVVDTLFTAGLTGYELYAVHVIDSEQSSATLPPLYELVVVGKGGPMGAEAGLHLVTKCDRCGYRGYESVYYDGSGAYKFRDLYVNVETWDGSDFFTFDDWPTIIMITEKAKSDLSSAGLSNWRAYPAPIGASS
jgi:hypothetical protein